jgi:hypothetical protein
VQFATKATNHTICYRKGIFKRCGILLTNSYKEKGKNDGRTESVRIMGRAQHICRLQFILASKYFLAYHSKLFSAFVQKSLKILG